MHKRLTPSIAFAAILTILLSATAFAKIGPSDDGAIDNAKATHGQDAHHQHGGEIGHIDVVNYNVDLVSKLELANVVEGKIADVGVFGDYAYLAAWGGQTCKQNGVHVVDISDVDSPQEVNFIPAKGGSYPGEGVQALHISTPAFNGDILVTNNERCRPTAGVGGMNIYDVTDPVNHMPLAVGVGDTTDGATKLAHEIHSVFAWDAGNKAYAVMVDNQEAPDVDIMDITNPRRPKLIAEYDLNADMSHILDASLGAGESFLHDMIVKKIGDDFVMLVSYWDGGYVTLNVNDPKNPVYIGDSDFGATDTLAAERGLTVPPEGNAHQAEFSRDNDFIIAADEDFNPYKARAVNVTEGTNFPSGGLGSDTPQLAEGDSVEGQTVFVGRACPGDPAVPTASVEGQIAVVERGLCLFSEKLTIVDAVNAGAGPNYGAVLVVNRTASDGCEGALGMTVEGDTMSFGVAPRSVAYSLFNLSEVYDEAACKAGDGTQLLPISVGATGDTVKFESYFDGWGYVHLFDNGAGKLTELDTFAVPEAHQPAHADGSGDMSVHEVAMSHEDNTLAYLSYYAAGLRVLRNVDGELVEVGAFIDESGDGGNNFWGVQTFSSGGQEYVAASDRDYGLYIFEYTGD